MPNAAVSDAEFLEIWKRHGSAQGVADQLGIAVRSVHNRRKRFKERGFDLPSIPAVGYEGHVPDYYRDDEQGWTFPRELRRSWDTGSVVISSDHHYWPNQDPVAHRALLKVCKVVKPRAKILNGDVMDGVRTGRHPPFGWSHRPSVIDELTICQQRLGEIEQALPRGCERIWNIGNHDIRFERAVATKAPEFTGVKGMRLADHFPGWEMYWSTLINGETAHPVMVKHKNAGGVHAGYNNTMKGGFTSVTGHTHILEAKPWGDWRGRRWGIQTGTICDLHAPQFEYQENSPSPACSGFVVLTFAGGQLLPPETCEVISGRAWFRGQIVAE